MQYSDYTEEIKKRLQKYFDINPASNYAGEMYDIVATFSSKDVQTFLSKKNIIDYSESNELCLVSHTCDNLEEELSKLPVIAMKATGQLSVHHKSTVLLRVFVSDDTVSQNYISCVNHFRFDKWHRFGFYGWTVIKVLLVDLKCKKVYSNRAAAGLKKKFAPV